MYCISQRAEHIWEGVSSATTRSPPDHQHPRRAARRRRALPPAARHRRRLEHERVRDVPQGGCGSILLRMLEDPNVVLRDMTLVRGHPFAPSVEISHDLTCQRRVRLANGREASALEIQGEFLTRALRYAEHHDLGPDRDPARSRCGSTASRASSSDPMLLDRECDWVIKHKLIEAVPGTTRPATSPTPRSPSSISSTTTSTAAGGSYYRMQDRGLVERTVTDAPSPRGRVGAPDRHGPAARRLHPTRQGAQAGLHRRLGAPEAERS